MANERNDPLELSRLDAAPPLHQRVHQQLEALIVGRTMSPGARIVEGDLAQQLGVSRGPIREALQALARDGFVDLRPRQGAFVHMPTKKEIADFFDIRRSLEVTSAGLAAQRIQPAQVPRLRTVIDKATEMLAHGQDPSAARSEVDIHGEITAIADNVLLGQLLSNLKRRSDWYSPPFDPVMRRNAWRQHVEMVDAIVARDSVAAQDIMGRHIDDSRDHFWYALSGDEPHLTLATAV